MTRCALPAPVRACAVPGRWLPALALTLLVQSVQAQPPRLFPATALRGEIVVTQPPQVLLNGRPAQLAPGARIRGSDNMMIMSGTVVNQRLTVHYTLDILGNVNDVWVLRPSELARRPWPATPAQAQAWQFNADLQQWTPR